METNKSFARLRAAWQELRRTRSLAGAGLLASAGVVLNQFTFAVSQFLEIGISFLAPAAAGFLYGPFVAGLAGVVLDIIGYVLRPNGAYFIGFTLNEFLAGFLYGCVLYKKPVTLPRCLLACMCTALVLNLCLTPLWLHMMYGNAFVLTSMRLIKNAIQLPVNTLLLYALLRVVQRHAKR